MSELTPVMLTTSISTLSNSIFTSNDRRIKNELEPTLINSSPEPLKAFMSLADTDQPQPKIIVHMILESLHYSYTILVTEIRENFVSPYNQTYGLSKNYA